MWIIGASLDYGNLISKNRTIKYEKIILNLDFDLPCRTSPRRCSRGFPDGWIFYKIDDFLENYEDCFYLISISTFLVELYLDVVHKVRLVIGFEFLANKTCRYIPKEDSLKKLWWLINKWRWHYFFKHLKKEKKIRSFNYKKIH